MVKAVLMMRRLLCLLGIIFLLVPHSPSFAEGWYEAVTPNHRPSIETSPWRAEIQPVATGSGPTIGAQPDGTFYEVLHVTEIAKPAAVQCGFNKMGAPNTGIFSVEARQYRSYANGRLMKQWQESFETFKSCHHP